MSKDKKPKLFVPSVKISEAIRDSLRTLASYKRGDGVPTEVLEEVAGFGRRSPSWPSYIGRLKRDLRKQRGMVLWGEPRGGYRFLTAKEQVEMVPVARGRRAARQMTRAIKEVACTPDDELNAFDRRRKQETEDRLRDHRNRQRAGNRLFIQMRQKQERMPRM